MQRSTTSPNRLGSVQDTTSQNPAASRHLNPMDNDLVAALSPGLSMLTEDAPPPPLPQPTATTTTTTSTMGHHHTTSTTTSTMGHHHTTATTAPPVKRPRCSYNTGIAAILEDMVDLNVDKDRFPEESTFDDAVTTPEDLEELLVRAAPSTSAAVCALIYAARLDHQALALSPINVHAVVAAALAMGAMYVDRLDMTAACLRVVSAAGISTDTLSELITCFVQHLGPGQTYISVACFRDFQEHLDCICNGGPGARN